MSRDLSTPRVPAGLPAGGQFTASGKAEAGLALTETPATSTRQTSEPLEQLAITIERRRARGIYQMIDEGDVDLAPPYQRDSVWTTDQRINLIRSLLSRTPIPAVIVNFRRTPRWYSANNTDMNRTVGEPAYAVVDGRQRLETLVAWFEDDLAVPASWWPTEHVESTVETDDGPYVTWSGLTPAGRSTFSTEATMPWAEGTLSTVEEEAEMYLRVNTAGTAQSDDDLANAADVAGR